MSKGQKEIDYARIIIPGRTRVILPESIGAERLYYPTDTFPVWGSHKESIGTVIGINKSEDRAEVLWDNGSRNNFPIRQLEIVDGKGIAKNPNIGFKNYKIKNRLEGGK